MRFFPHGLVIDVIDDEKFGKLSEKVIVRVAKLLNHFYMPSHRVATKSFHIIASLLSRMILIRAMNILKCRT